MATIKDVARMAGVSISTVSKYLNGGNVRPENLEPIRSAIAALDYRANPFARCLKAQRSRSIGILLPNMAAPFFGTMVMALDTILREHGYHSMICCYGSSHGLERDYFRFLLSTGVDGMVYVPEDLSAEEFRELTAQRPIPVVQVDRAIQGVETDAVLVNTAIAVAHDPVAMARAFRLATEAGRMAYIAGLGQISDCAQASSPLTSFLND